MSGYSPHAAGVPVLCIERPGVGKVFHPIAPHEDPKAACRVVWGLAVLLRGERDVVWYVIPAVEPVRDHEE